MNELALFSGIGGLSLALHMADPSITTVCHVEIDRYAAGVLMSRMRDGSIPFAPIWDDVRTFDGRPWRGVVDIISGGFPCQDISIAGKRAGIKTDTRSGLWFEFARLIDEIRPRYAFLENVPAIITNGLGTVLGSLAEMGYDADWCCIAATELGAPFKGERWFCLSSTKSVSCDSTMENERDKGEKPLLNLSRFMGNKLRQSASDNWRIEPDVGRVAHGVCNRVDKLRCLGNAVVPQQAALAWQILTGAINGRPDEKL